MNPMRDSSEDFSEWLHAGLVREFANETEQWAIDRVTRVQKRLNEYRSGYKPLTTTILWLPSAYAFTLHGSNVYIARHLLERLPSDDGVAFILAHEAAHHDLGHLDRFAGWANWIPKSDATAYVAAVTRLLEHNRYGPERENDADQYALKLCALSGFDIDVATETLQIVENIALDAGDVSGVFGPENLLDPTDPHRTSYAYRAQEWVWTRMRGYYPLHERLTRLRELNRKIKNGTVRL